jgi:hypothetical protein
MESAKLAFSWHGIGQIGRILSRHILGSSCTRGSVVPSLIVATYISPRSIATWQVGYPSTRSLYQPLKPMLM